MNHSTDNSLVTFVPPGSGKRGQRCRGANSHDVTLLEGLGRTFYWQKLLDSGKFATIAEIAKAEGLTYSLILSRTN